MDTEDSDSKPLTPTVYKKQEYDSYLMWLSMPAILRGQPRHVIEKFGIDDELAISLLEIKSQKEFAKKFGIKDLGTLSGWNKRIENQGGLLKFSASWAKRLSPNVLSALYREATKTGKAAEVKLWFEIVEGM
jgi:hypothetical protein